MSSRRDFLKIASLATACVAARGTVLAAAEEPVLGLIFPPLNYERIPEGGATQEILFKLGADTYAKSTKADALVISCGALRTLDLIVPLENETKAPVVSSTPHGLMNGVRMLGISPRAKGFGMVFEKV